MNHQLAKIVLPAGALASCLLALYLAMFRPSYLYRLDLLGGFVFVQLAMFAVWKYKDRFFPFMVLSFLWAGTSLPLAEAWNVGRWATLAVGTIAGLMIYAKAHKHHFDTLHLIGLFAVSAAVVSALVSNHPDVAILKAGSLFLLFLYASTGGRLAVIAREAKFFSGLLLGCEVVVYVCAVSYFVFRYEVLGNPNSLGAVMGVVVVPLLVWGVLVTQPLRLRRRRGFALILGLALLLSSYSRASILAAVVACGMLCIGMKRYKLLAAVVGAGVLCAVIVLTLAPPEAGQSDSMIATFLYKGHQESGALGSRRSVWDDTVDSIRRHPWFGTGFGTSATTYDSTQTGTFASGSATTREHGNSYLAIAEWVGMLGVLPFLLLLVLIASNVIRVVVWMRRTGDPFVSAVPMAAILAAGLVHAAFEDWMFAVGYYLCVFFWILAFSMSDVLPALKPAITPIVLPPSNPRWRGELGTVASSR